MTGTGRNGIFICDNESVFPHPKAEPPTTSRPGLWLPRGPPPRDNATGRGGCAEESLQARDWGPLLPRPAPGWHLGIWIGRVPPLPGQRGSCLHYIECPVWLVLDSRCPVSLGFGHLPGRGAHVTGFWVSLLDSTAHVLSPLVAGELSTSCATP